MSDHKFDTRKIGQYTGECILGVPDEYWLGPDSETEFEKVGNTGPGWESSFSLKYRMTVWMYHTQGDRGGPPLYTGSPPLSTTILFLRSNMANSRKCQRFLGNWYMFIM